MLFVYLLKTEYFFHFFTSRFNIFEIQTTIFNSSFPVTYLSGIYVTNHKSVISLRNTKYSYCPQIQFLDDDDERDESLVCKDIYVHKKYLKVTVFYEL